jgi:hypothetical protein
VLHIRKLKTRASGPARYNRNIYSCYEQSAALASNNKSRPVGQL